MLPQAFLPSFLPSDSFGEPSPKLYFATQEATPVPFAPHSPVVELIQGIYALHGAEAMRVLRQRIYFTGTPTEMCQGMLKVAAKRLSVVSPAEGAELFERMRAEGYDPVRVSAPAVPAGAALSILAEPPLLDPGMREDSDSAWLKLAFRLAEKSPCRGKKIAALLVSPAGELLSYGVNSDSPDRTLHAEVNLLQAYFARTGQATPRGARLYTTLKPCRMCAGMIWHCAQDPHALRVLYGEDDPGPHGRNTVLTRAVREGWAVEELLPIR